MKKPWKKLRASTVFFLTCAFGLIIGLGQPTTAHAYLDPGSGSIFLQILLGGFAGLAVGLKLLKGKIRKLWSGKDHSNGN